MTPLSATQARFQDALRASHAQPGLFVDEARSEGGFRLYLIAYRARLLAALRENFPVLARALGDDEFDALAVTYLDAHPSPHRSIRWFGDTFCDFLGAAPERLPHPALLDLARMDWALCLAYDATDATPVTAATLRGLPPDAWAGLRFALHPSVSLLTVDWLVAPIWHALNDDADAQTEAPEPGVHTLMVWRRELECHWRTLDELEAQALAAIRDGAPYGDVCAGIAERLGVTPDEAARAATVTADLLRQWLTHGVLVLRPGEA